MTTKLSLLTSLAAASVLTALAAERDADQRDTTLPQVRTHRDSRYNPVERLGKVTKATEITGTEIKNPQGEKLGKVEELAVDIEAGRIVLVIVSSGGFLGIGDKTVAVPPRAFTCDENDKILRLNVDKEKLKAAPAFEMSKWRESFETNRVVESYRYYGQEPYFVGVYQPSGDDRANQAYRDRKHYQEDKTSRTSSCHLGHVEKASKLIGMSVKNRQDEKLGDVEDLMLDLGSGRIVHVVVSSGGFLGLGDELSVAPPAAFHYDTAKGVLHLDTTKEALMTAPHFRRSEWPDSNDPAYVVGVYRAYRVEPYFLSDADNTKRNIRDRETDALTPLDQGSSDADVMTTRQIRKEILDHKGLSVNARNVKVITRDGRITLRGPVNSEEEKRLLGEIAGRAAPRKNVDNQLEVKRDK